MKLNTNLLTLLTGAVIASGISSTVGSVEVSNPETHSTRIENIVSSLQSLTESKPNSLSTDRKLGLCDFCSDGSGLKDEFLNKDIYNGLTCRDLKNYWSLLLLAHDCSDLQIASHIFCGCPTGHPPVSDPCPLCPEGFEISDPDKETDYGKTCGTIADAVKGIQEDANACTLAQTQAVEIECCVQQKSCLDNPGDTFAYKKKNKTCYWLNTLTSKKKKWACNKYADKVCPTTCKDKCFCRDEPKNKFHQKNNKKRSCQWLYKQDRKKVRKVCKKSKDAWNACPDSCEGWCRL